MRPSPAPLLAACLALLLLPAAGSSAALPSPQGLVVAEGEGRVLLAWAPVPVAGAVRYHVYGGEPGALALLGTTEAPLYSGEGGRGAYAVAAVVDGAESPASSGCIWVDWAAMPPQVVYEPGCDRRAPQPAQVLLPEASVGE